MTSPHVSFGGTAGSERRPKRSHARHQLGELERLAQIVVGAQLEPLHAIAEGRRRGQHKHPRGCVVIHQLAADLVAVHARQVAVEHDHVIRVDGHVHQRVRAVQRDIDRHALAAKSLGDRLGQPGLVLHDQHSHRTKGSRIEGHSQVTPPVTEL